jgi:hypothetical protein
MTPWTILPALPLTTGGYVCEARIPGVRAQFHGARRIEAEGKARRWIEQQLTVEKEAA